MCEEIKRCKLCKDLIKTRDQIIGHFLTHHWKEVEDLIISNLLE